MKLKTLIILFITWLVKRYITAPKMDTLKEIRDLQEQVDELRKKYLAALAKKPVDRELIELLRSDRMQLNNRIARLRRELSS